MVSGPTDNPRGSGVVAGQAQFCATRLGARCCNAARRPLFRATVRGRPASPIARRCEKMACVSQPPGPHSVELTINRIAEGSGRLLASASALTDDQLREPSL